PVGVADTEIRLGVFRRHGRSADECRQRAVVILLFRQQSESQREVSFGEIRVFLDRQLGVADRFAVARRGASAFRFARPLRLDRRAHDELSTLSLFVGVFFTALAFFTAFAFFGAFGAAFVAFVFVAAFVVSLLLGLFAGAFLDGLVVRLRRLRGR